MEYLKGKYHCTIDLLFDWFGISCMTTDNFCIYFQNRLIQTSQTGGQLYSDTPRISIPWIDNLHQLRMLCDSYVHTSKDSESKLRRDLPLELILSLI